MLRFLMKETSLEKRSGMARHFTVLIAVHTHAVNERNEPYLPLSFQPSLVLIDQPQKDERLSWLRHHSGE